MSTTTLDPVRPQRSDWVLPYWLERSPRPLPAKTPDSASARPPAASSGNFVHRSWTAIGHPEFDHHALVDPRGLVTPQWHGWSLDHWMVWPHRRPLLPSRLRACEQTMRIEDGYLEVRTVAETGSSMLTTSTAVIAEGSLPFLRTRMLAASLRPGWAAVSLRPFHPDGAAAIHSVELSEDRHTWIINGRPAVRFNRPVALHFASDGPGGDVVHWLPEGDPVDQVHCAKGLATAVALFPTEPHASEMISYEAVLSPHHALPRPEEANAVLGPWYETLSKLSRLELPDARWRQLYDAAAINVVLNTRGDVQPGPWSAVADWPAEGTAMVDALLTLGATDRAREVLARLALADSPYGLARTLEHAFEVNGRALWMFGRYASLQGGILPDEWIDGVLLGACWLEFLGATGPFAGVPLGADLAGQVPLEPLQFEERLWAVAGLRAASRLTQTLGWPCASELAFAAEAELRATWPGRRAAGFSRRPRAGAARTGTPPIDLANLLVGSHPLRLVPADEPALVAGADWLCHRRIARGLMHNGGAAMQLNPAQTLQLAQVYLRMGDLSIVWALMDAVAALASPTGHWPESIDPRTGAGCLGDGQHAGASAEWLLLIRNLFVREEGETLVLGAGIKPAWLASGQELVFGPTLTPFGKIEIAIRATDDIAEISVEAEWRGPAPTLDLRVPGFHPRIVSTGERPLVTQLERVA